jgi:glycosyltransferase involved in cell wall biosynthesis
MVGRLHAVKAVDLALAAFKEARGDFPQMRLKIVGHGGERHKLQALAKRLAIEDSVDWLGPVVGEEKEGLIREATALLLTSHVEAFCLSALEAMALGTPVIVPDRRPFTDIIGDRNGLFIRPDEPKTLVLALERLTKPGYVDELGRRGLEVAAGFTRAAAVDDYENIYYRLVAQGNK